MNIMRRLKVHIEALEQLNRDLEAENALLRSRLAELEKPPTERADPGPKKPRTK